MVLHANKMTKDCRVDRHLLRRENIQNSINLKERTTNP